MARYQHNPAYDDPGQPAHRIFMYVLMLVIAAAFAGFIWNWYSGASQVPVIRAPAGAYKVAPSPDALTAPDEAESNIPNESPGGSPPLATPRPAPEAPAAAGAQAGGVPQLGAAPHFVSDGPYVAQVAALQSEASVNPAWARFSSRAPQLFAPARLDVERADLGARGIYYRVRAGYFADRANATRFCDRIRQMGQDCIVVAR